MEEVKEQTTNEKLLVDTANEITKGDKMSAFDTEGFIRSLAMKFVENKLHDFPRICDVFRMQNKLKMDALAKEDNPEGWSESKNWKWDYDIPTDLYYFMVNLVYRNFWEEDNEKVWRPFLKALMRGDDAIETLMKVKMIYGSSEEAQKAGII